MRHIPTAIILMLILSGCGPQAERTETPVPAAPKIRSTPTPAEQPTEAGVREILASHFHVDAKEIPFDQSLDKPPLQADELDLVEIIMELEDRYSITIPDGEVSFESTDRETGLPAVRVTPQNLVKIVDTLRRQAKKPAPRSKK